MDYLLIEAVPVLRASAAVAAARKKCVEEEMVSAGLLVLPAPAPVGKEGKESGRESAGSVVGGPGAGAGLGEEEEAVRARLEAIGTHVGANFAER